MTLLRVETHMRSFDFHELESLFKCHLAILNEECHDDHRASATSSFTVHVSRVLLHVNLLVNKIHTPTGMHKKRQDPQPSSSKFFSD